MYVCSVPRNIPGETVDEQVRRVVFWKRDAHNSPFPPIAGVFEEIEGIFDQCLPPGGAAAVRGSGFGGREQLIAQFGGFARQAFD